MLWPCPLPATAAGELVLLLTGGVGVPLWRPGLINSTITQAHIQCFELTHPNINPIQDLLESMTGPVLGTIDPP